MKEVCVSWHWHAWRSWWFDPKIWGWWLSLGCLDIRYHNEIHGVSLKGVTYMEGSGQAAPKLPKWWAMEITYRVDPEMESRGRIELPRLRLEKRPSPENMDGNYVSFSLTPSEWPALKAEIDEAMKLVALLPARIGR